MNRLARGAVVVVVVAGAGIVAYHTLLTEEARERLEATVSTVKDTIARVATVVEDVKGHEMQEDVLPNREKTRAEWEALGY